MKPVDDGMVRVDPITTAGLAAKLGMVVTGRTMKHARNQGTGSTASTVGHHSDRSDDAGPASRVAAG
jgi:hypothetical protein